MASEAPPGDELARLHSDRGRALSFGGIAELYDRARPSYPSALIDDLVATKPRDVLDVGCGTGKAGRLLLARGCDVLGIEPDARMAERARAHGLTVEESTFEAWEPGARQFDLLISGQAWHWVDPAVGPGKAMRLLRPGAPLAAFWNLGRHDPRTLAALQPVYTRLAPHIADSAAALGHIQDGDDRGRIAALSAVPGVAGVELRTYGWDAEYSRQAWLDFIATHSDHALLPDAQRAALLDGVGGVIDARGGSLIFHFQTALILATRRGE